MFGFNYRTLKLRFALLFSFLFLLLFSFLFFKDCALSVNQVAYVFSPIFVFAVNFVPPHQALAFLAADKFELT